MSYIDILFGGGAPTIAGELFDAVLMCVVLGYIFMDAFRRPIQISEDPLEQLTLAQPGFDWKALGYAIAAASPAVLLHELGHKIAGMLLGFSTVFHASYWGLGIGVVLKLLNTGLLFFIPGYVSISGNGTALAYALTAFAGPFVNFVLWIGAKTLVQHQKIPRTYLGIAIFTQKINGFLCVFNLLPIPGFDGFTGYTQLYKMFF